MRIYVVINVLVIFCWGAIMNKCTSSSESTAIPFPAPAAEMEKETTSDEQMIAEKNYIEWDDMKVDLKHHQQHYNKNNNNKYNWSSSSKIIVVDKNGNGDDDSSVVSSVQAAIDLVPLHNRFRYKIFIRPGIYR